MKSLAELQDDIERIKQELAALQEQLNTHLTSTIQHLEEARERLRPH